MSELIGEYIQAVSEVGLLSLFLLVFTLFLTFIFAIILRIIPKRYRTRFEFIVFLCFSGYICYLYGFLSSEFEGFQYHNNVNHMKIVLEESVPLYDDYHLTIPRGEAEKGSECIAINTSRMQYFVNPLDLLKDKYELFCKNNIGWADLKSGYSPLISNYKWMRILFVLVVDGLLLMSLYLLFSLIQTGILYLKEDPIRDNLIKDNAATDD